MKQAENARSTRPIIPNVGQISRAATPPRPLRRVQAEQIPLFGADGQPMPVDVMYLAFGRSTIDQSCATCYFFQRSRDPEGLPSHTCAKYPLAGIPEWFGSFGACGLYERGGGL